MDQDLKAYLDSRFAEFGGRITELRDEMDGRFTEMDGRTSEIRDQNHQARILVEKLNDKIDLVAEGVQANTEILHRHTEQHRQEREEDRDLFGSSIRHLERRVTRHEEEIGELKQRVGRLEPAKA